MSTEGSIGYAIRVSLDRDSPVWELDAEESRKAYVASLPVILCRSYVFRGLRPRIFWIYSGDTAVGAAPLYASSVSALARRMVISAQRRAASASKAG